MWSDRITLRLSHFIGLRNGAAWMLDAAPFEISQSDDPRNKSEHEKSWPAIICICKP